MRRARTVFGASLVGERGYVTILLIALNVGVFIGTVALSGARAAIGQGSDRLFTPATQLTSLLGVFPPAIVDGEYWRLITAMFIHFGVLHLAINMWTLWLLGRALERALGPARFTGLYLLCGAGGNVAVYLFSPTGTLSGGASTALFGLFAALFAINRRLGLSNDWVIVMIAINLGLTIAVPNISIAGHLGGLVTGAMSGFGLAFAPRSDRAAVGFLVLIGIAVLLIVLTLLRTSMLLPGA